MRLAVRIVLGLTCLSLSLTATAQISQPIVSLHLDGDPQPTQLPASAGLSGVQCDESGAVYVRYAQQTDNFSSPTIARIDDDGSTQTISLGSLPNSSADQHAFVFTAAQDGTLHEILRLQPDATGDPQIDYVRFDPDGAFRSQATFQQEFVPSLLLPLPSGNFFAAGVTLKRVQDSISEGSLAGIFSPEAVLLQPLRKNGATLTRVGAKQQVAAGDITNLVQGATAKLADDGNIYVLLAADHARVAVITQSGEIVRELTLQEPFEVGAANDMWVSGNRVLVAYEGEADDPKNATVYVLYDAHTGEVVRAYKPDFLGTATCFQDGQTLTVFVHPSNSGAIAIASAQLQ